MAFSAPFSAPQMDWENNDSILAISKFRQKCELIFKSILKEADGEEQVSYILLWVGEQGIDIYNSWTFVDAGNRKDLTKILDRCDKTKVSQSIILFLRSRTLELINWSSVAMRNLKIDYLIN